MIDSPGLDKGKADICPKCGKQGCTCGPECTCEPSIEDVQLDIHKQHDLVQDFEE
jgi:hypothetical protein